MKHLLKNIVGLCILLATAVGFASCEQDAQIKEYVYPMPEVSEVSPNIGYVASKVIIRGTNFGDRPEPVKVFFGGVQATNVLMCKNNRIVVEVPENALSGDVTLQIWKNEVGVIGKYTVLPTPFVVSAKSENALGEGVAETGDVVTIKGGNFGSVEADVKVSFNGTPATKVKLVDASTIEATTPADYLSGDIIVTIRDYTMTGSAMFNPNAKGEVTSIYLKNYGPGFTKFDITEAPFNRQWYTPANWEGNKASGDFNMALQEADGTTYIAFQIGWSKAKYNNGKLWQAAKLRPGTYRLEISYANSSVLENAGNKVFAFIVTGKNADDIPNTDEITKMEESKGVRVEYDKYVTKEEAFSGTLTTPPFKVTGPETDVLIGFLTSMNQGNSYFKVSQIKLILD